MNQDTCKLSLSDLKKVNRQLKRQKAKLQRKVNTLRQLQESNYLVGGEISILREQEHKLTSPTWTPQSEQLPSY